MTGHRTIDSSEAARALAQMLNGDKRTKPVVVVTIPAGREAPWIDVEEIVERVGDLAEVYLMPTNAYSWELSHNLPEMTQVYGGAGRVYPVGHEWTIEPRTSPLRFAYDAEDGKRATDLLIDDALRMATAAGLVDSKPTAKRIRRTGTVAGIIAERAMVKLDHDFGVVPDSLAYAGVPLERALRPGMKVTGLFDTQTHWFDVRESRLDPIDALGSYAIGDLVLAQVGSVEADVASVFLHPLVQVTVTRAEVSSSELDDLRTLMTPHEVLAAHVRSIGPDWQLSLLDVDDDEVPVPAAPLFEGGPPWLDPPAATPAPAETPANVSVPLQRPPVVSPAPSTEQVEAEEPPLPPPSPPAASPLLLDRHRSRASSATAGPEASASASESVHHMSLTIDALRAQVAALTEERDAAAARAASQDVTLQLALNDLRQAQANARYLERQLAASRSSLRKTRSRRTSERVIPHFADRERGFRFLVEMAWAERIPPAEQPECPLPDYFIGPDFLDSLDELQGMSTAKVAAVVMEVLTGKAELMDGRKLHRLRESDSGNGAYVTRDDGANAMRVNLQTNTASARRLHYWKSTDGTIELAKVGLHDDYSI